MIQQHRPVGDISVNVSGAMCSLDKNSDQGQVSTFATIQCGVATAATSASSILLNSVESHIRFGFNLATLGIF